MSNLAKLTFATGSIGLLLALRFMSGSNEKQTGQRGKDNGNLVRKSTRPRVKLEDFPQVKNDLLLRAAKGEDVERVPVWMMRQAGRYLPEFRELRKNCDFFTMCQTPDLACKVSLQPLERFETLDAVIIFSDILVIPQAMGMEVLMIPGRGPVFPEPLATPQDMDRLDMNPDIEETLGYVFDAVNLTRERIAGRVPLIGFSGAPFTLMGYMVEGGGSKNLSKVKTWLVRYPQEAHKLLDALMNVIVAYLVQKVAAGAQLLQIFESNGGDLSPEHFNEFSMPYLENIARRVKKRLAEQNLPVVPMTVFARGANQEGALEALANSSYDAVSIDWRIEPSVARARVPTTKATIQGNLDPAMLYASKTDIREAVKRMLDGFGTKRYIANLGHGMHPDHDPEHAHEFILAVQQESAAKVKAKNG